MKYTKISLIFALLPVVAFGTDDDCMTRKNVPDGVLDLQRVIELGLCQGDGFEGMGFAVGECIGKCREKLSK